MKTTFATVLLACLSLCIASCATPPVQTLYLVRHAEKVAAGDDPGLTEAGDDRASALAARLAQSGVEAIWSSDYLRTRSTAQPVADATGLPVRIYDPRQLEDLSAQLVAEGADALVVGHSNTTPVLADLLGGEAGDPIVEAWEYDRLYVIRRYGDGRVETQLERYGAPSAPMQ